MLLKLPKVKPETLPENPKPKPRSIRIIKKGPPPEPKLPDPIPPKTEPKPPKQGKVQSKLDALKFLGGTV